MLPVYVDLYFCIYYTSEVKEDKEVLPTVCSAKTAYWVYFMKRAGSLARFLHLKIWAAVEAEELLFLKMYLKILARPLDFQQLYIFLKISVDFPFVLVDAW